MTMRRIIGVLLGLATTLLLAGAIVASPSESTNFVAVLSGGEEVPARDTQARGLATFQLDGTTLSYRLIASNIHNVTQAHIHAPAPAGTNANVVIWLYPTAGGSGPAEPPGAGRTDGVLMTGEVTVTATQIAWLRTGMAYVNVHTNDGVGSTNTGPGDFPGGEIRGQIQENGPTE